MARRRIYVLIMYEYFTSCLEIVYSTHELPVMESTEVCTGVPCTVLIFCLVRMIV